MLLKIPKILFREMTQNLDLGLKVYFSESFEEAQILAIHGKGVKLAQKDIQFLYHIRYGIYRQ